jgi:hypothetical protein
MSNEKRKTNYFLFRSIQSKMLAVSGRCVSRANVLTIIRQASSNSNKNKDEPVAVSHADADSGPSPMSQRSLPPDDGKVRM